jgi:protocatechuate 3,4-dioxygenase beta subunit
MNILICTILTVCLAALPVYAQGYKPATCVPTASIPIVNYPGADNIPHGNNLVLPAGKSVEAEGQKLMIVGRLFDNRCLPIKDAQIEIWQPDPFGKWFLASRADLATPSPVFAGAGRGYSSNTGDFIFSTLFPSGVDKRAPFINIKIKVRGMKEFNTQLFFANDGRNGTDPVYSKLKPDAARSVTFSMQPLANGEGYAGMIDIILSEKARYVSY